MTIKTELQIECLRNGLTLEALAGKIGVTPATLHRKLNGKFEFSRQEMCVLRSTLHLSNERFMQIFFAN